MLCAVGAYPCLTPVWGEEPTLGTVPCKGTTILRNGRSWKIFHQIHPACIWDSISAHILPKNIESGFALLDMQIMIKEQLKSSLPQGFSVQG